MTRNRRRPQQAAEHAARRQMIRHLLDRLDREEVTGARRDAEAAMLRHLVTLDQADGDKHRSAAIGQQRAAQRLRGQLDAAETAIREAEQRAEWHANNAATELRVLRAGLRANGADPTQIQNLWAQIRMRNRQWREEKQRAQQAEEHVKKATARGDHWKRVATEIETDRDALLAYQHDPAGAYARAVEAVIAAERRQAEAEQNAEAYRADAEHAEKHRRAAEERAKDVERQLADMTRDRDGWWAAAERATEEHGRRAERAEAALARARAECDRITADRAHLDSDSESFGDGLADAVARVLDALDGPTAKPEPEPCERHPGASTIAGMCAMCTRWPTAEDFARRAAEPEPEHTTAPDEERTAPTCDVPHHTHYVIPPGPDCQREAEQPDEEQPA